ncbi:MAG: CDP-alcohol phosphatidyltransferase family protein [bacterium]|nr:CDP-alcohol phosphatidyltransferase family protein [bacterium]MCY3924096.1 CDP-alcohol phosphatidyltransferase family protein [bacterium]
MSAASLRRQLWTVPNLVTILRLAALPIFCWLLFGLDDRAAAGILLGALGASDFLDGYLARRLGQATDLGAVLDPVVDRFMFFAAVIAMLVNGDVARWFGITALAREFGLSVGTLILASKRVGWLGVNAWGKSGSFGLMFAFPMLLLGASEIAGAGAWRIAGWVCGVPSLAVAWYGAWLYVPAARAALAAPPPAGS